jgi:hypothetical protein
VEATITVSVATGMVRSRCRRRRGGWCGSTCRPAPSDNNKTPKQGQQSDSGRSGSERARDRRATSPDPAWAGCLFRVGEHCLFETPNASLQRRVQQMKSSTVALAAAPLSLSDQRHHTRTILHRLTLNPPTTTAPSHLFSIPATKPEQPCAQPHFGKTGIQKRADDDS